jgi:hypothetical protein
MASEPKPDPGPAGPADAPDPSATTKPPTGPATRLGPGGYPIAAVVDQQPLIHNAIAPGAFSSDFNSDFYRGRTETPIVMRATDRPDNARFELVLAERPEEVRNAVRELSKAIADQIEEMNARKPNGEDGLDRHEEVISFLQTVAKRLDELADTLDGAIEAKPAEKEPLFGRAAAIARSIGEFVLEGLSTHRPALRAAAIQVPVLACSVLLLHLLGVNSTTAFLGVLAIMGYKPPKDDQKG